MTGAIRVSKVHLTVNHLFPYFDVVSCTFSANEAKQALVLPIPDITVSTSKWPKSFFCILVDLFLCVCQD